MELSLFQTFPLIDCEKYRIQKAKHCRLAGPGRRPEEDPARKAMLQRLLWWGVKA